MAQVHRFADTAAIGGQYVTAHDARKLGLALVAIADSIEREYFAKSKGLTVEVKGYEYVSALEQDQGPVCNVNFRKWPEDEGGDVIALMVDNPAHPQDLAMVGSYQHVGQHSDASAALFDDLEQAHPGDFEPLKRELEGLGYVLRVFDYYPDTSPRQAAPENESQGETRPTCAGMENTL